MRITSKGQVTIPLDIREKLGLLPHCEVEFTIDGDRVLIRKVRGKKSRGEQTRPCPSFIDGLSGRSPRTTLPTLGRPPLSDLLPEAENHRTLIPAFASTIRRSKMEVLRARRTI